MTTIYDRFRDACASRGTNITTVLNELGKSDGSTGAWKAGKSPRLETAMEIAEHLGMSLDELVYGTGSSRAAMLTSEEAEWLAIFRRIPKERREMCKDFLRTHVVEPEVESDKRGA